MTTTSDIENQTTQKQQNPRKNLWLILGGFIAVVFLVGLGFHVASAEKDIAFEDSPNPFTSTTEPAGSLSPEQKQEFAEMIRNIHFINNHASELNHLLKSSVADISEIVETAQSKKDTFETEKLRIKMGTAAICFAVDKVDCFKKLDDEIRASPFSSEEESLYTWFKVKALLLLPYARFGAVQRTFLDQVKKEDAIEMVNYFGEVLTHFNPSQLSYMIKHVKKTTGKADINYQAVAGYIARNYEPSEHSNEDIKKSVKLMKGITGIDGFSVEDLRKAIEGEIKVFERGITSRKIAALKEYKKALDNPEY